MARLNLTRIPRKNPQTKLVQYYLQKQNYSLISNDKLVERIAENTSISASVVNATVSAIFDTICNFCMNGHSVQLGNFMSIRPVLKSTGVDSLSDANVGQLTGIMLRAYWGNGIRSYQNPKNYTFITVD